MSQQRQTPTHTQITTPLHHNAHTHTQDNGRDTPAQYTTGRTAGKIHRRHPHRNTLLHTTTTRTHTHARAGNGNGGAMVKIGNIKVDLRSGAAALQERTRTHAHARIGFYIHSPVFLCVLFPCASLCRFMTFSDVVLPCLLTAWRRVVVVSLLCCAVFHAFCKCLYLRFEPFSAKM